MQGGTSFRMRAGQLFCACDSDGLPLAVGREPDPASIRVMALAFALSVLAQILTVSVLPLVSAPLAPTPQAVAWPTIALLAGGALSSFPASLLLDLFGRRAAFALGASLGLAGGVMSYWAVLHGQYIGLVIGVAWLGMAQGFGLFYRHAGAMASQGGAGTVFAAGTGAAVLAPVLMGGMDSLFGPLAAAGILALAGLVYLLTLGVAIRLPARKIGYEETDTNPDRPAVTAMLGATALAGLAWAVMTGVMAHAPLVMAGCGVGFSASAVGMALHLMAMYAPGLVIGRWVAAWGGLRVSLAGLLLLVAGAVLLSLQTAFSGLTLALVVAGAGWGIATIGASAWLHQGAQPSPMQLALHDMLLFVSAIAGAATLGF